MLSNERLEIRPWVWSVGLVFLAGCSGDGLRSDPFGSFHLGSVSFALGTDGAIQIEHSASSSDARQYLLRGSFTHTLEFTNEENETTYGHLDVTVTELVLNGKPGAGLDITPIFPGDDIKVGSLLLGWWNWNGLVTWGGMMQLRFNVPATKYRSEDPFHGNDWLLVGDPR